MTSKCNNTICDEDPLNPRCCIKDNFILSDHKLVCDDGNKILTFNIGGNASSFDSITKCNTQLHIKCHDDHTITPDKKEICRINFLLEQILRVAIDNKFKYICLQEVPNNASLEQFKKSKYKIIQQTPISALSWPAREQKFTKKPKEGPIDAASAKVSRVLHPTPGNPMEIFKVEDSSGQSEFRYPAYFEISSHDRKFYIVETESQQYQKFYVSPQSKSSSNQFSIFYNPIDNIYYDCYNHILDMGEISGFKQSDHYIPEILDFNPSYFLVDSDNLIYYRYLDNTLYSKKAKLSVLWDRCLPYSVYINHFSQFTSSDLEQVRPTDKSVRKLDEKLPTDELVRKLDEKLLTDKLKSELINQYMNNMNEMLINIKNVINDYYNDIEILKKIFKQLENMINDSNILNKLDYNYDTKDIMKTLNEINDLFREYIGKQGELKESDSKKLQKGKKKDEHIRKIDALLTIMKKIQKENNELMGKLKKNDPNAEHRGGHPQPQIDSQTVTLYLPGGTEEITKNTYQIVGLKLNKELIVNCKFPVYSRDKKFETVLSDFKKYICEQIEKYKDRIDKIIIVGDLNVIMENFERHFLLSKSSTIINDGVIYICIIEKENFDSVLAKYKVKEEDGDAGTPAEEMKRKYVKYKLKYLNFKLLQNVR